MATVIYLGGAPGFEATSKELDGIADVCHVAAEPVVVAAALVDADAMLDASMKVRITNAMVAAAPRLRMISCATTGSDHIERDELNARGVSVRTLKEDPDVLRSITPAAELSWALLMACARKLCPAVAHTRDGQWVREEFPGTMLNGKHLGLIGCGRIGGWMSRYAQAFGMTVSAFDPHRAVFPDGVSQASLEQVMANSDFISVHVHLSNDTRGMVSRELFARVRSGAVFINTSRGAIVDEAALLEALESGRLGGAGLDVLEGEPAIAEHPLIAYTRRRDNLLITPHCGGYSPDAVQVVCAHAASKIRSILVRGG